MDSELIASKFEQKSVVERPNFGLVQIVPKGGEITVTSKLMMKENKEADIIVTSRSKSKSYSVVTLQS
jgi:hypothetical protein